MPVTLASDPAPPPNNVIVRYATFADAPKQTTTTGGTSSAPVTGQLWPRGNRYGG